MNIGDRVTHLFACDFRRAAHPNSARKIGGACPLRFCVLQRLGHSSHGLPRRLAYALGSLEELRGRSRNGLPAFFSFSSSRAVQSHSPQAHGSEPFLSPNPRLVHIAQVLAPGNRACAQCPALNRLRQRPSATSFHPRSHQVSHVLQMTIPSQPLHASMYHRISQNRAQHPSAAVFSDY